MQVTDQQVQPISNGRAWRRALPSLSAGYVPRLKKRLKSSTNRAKEKSLALLQGLNSARYFWLPDLGSNQGPTD